MPQDDSKPTRLSRDVAPESQARDGAHGHSVRFPNDQSLKETGGAGLKALLELTDELVTQEDLHGLFAAVTASLRQVLKHEYSQLLLYDEATGWLKNCSAYFPSGKGLVHEGLLVPLENTPAGRVYKTRQPLRMERPDKERTPNDIVERLLAEGVRSGCCVPIAIRDEVLGVLSVGSSREAAFTEADQELLCSVANVVAVAIDDTLCRQKLRISETDLARRHARLQLVLEINNVLVTKLDVPELFAAISAALRRLTHHLYSQIVLYDAKTQQLVIRAVDFPAGSKGLIHEGLTVPPQTPAGAAFVSVQPTLIGKLERRHFPSDITDRMLEEGVRSVCLAPLVSHHRVLGVLSIGRSEEDGFTPADLEVLVAVANQVSIAVENALAFEQISELNQRLATENLYLNEEVRANSGFENIIGESSGLKQVQKQVETAAPTNATILLLGETGTGKELIARAIHDLSARAKATFVKLNCSAIPTGLLESELFGHEKGAFTGAIERKIGRLELAHGGTLFLDEIGDLPIELQPKLLRVLQDGDFERLGGTKTIHTDVRLIAATNRDLVQMVEDLTFREDLYYRLKVFPITIPPLRERPGDIPILVSYFVEKYARQMKKKIATIPQPAMQALMKWHWPGNIRELQNFLHRAVILSRGPALEIPMADLTSSPKRGTPRVTTLEEAEREHILRVLRETKGLVGTPEGAAVKLGLKRTTLHAKMRRLGITRRDFMT